MFILKITLKAGYISVQYGISDTKRFKPWCGHFI